MNLRETIERLRSLNQPVPIPPRLPTEEEVDAAEARLEVRFHPDYRTFLLEASDVTLGTLEPATLTLGDHTDLVDVAETAWREMGVPRELLPICEDNGDYFCLAPAGHVVHWSPDGQTDEEWPDLATWIEEVWING